MARRKLLSILQEETDGFKEQSRLRDDVLDAMEQAYIKGKNEQLTLTDVSQQRKLLIAELNKTDLEYIHQQGCTDILAEDLLRAINCG